jgi:hypothetical protein
MRELHSLLPDEVGDGRPALDYRPTAKGGKA